MKGDKEIINRLVEDNKLLIDKMASLEAESGEQKINERITELKADKCPPLN